MSETHRCSACEQHEGQIFQEGTHYCLKCFISKYGATLCTGDGKVHTDFTTMIASVLKELK